MEPRVLRKKAAGRRALGALAAAVLAFAAPAVEAVPFALADGNATVTVEPDLQEGVSAFNVAGISHVREQWYWLRVGAAGGETSLDQLDRGPATLTDTNMSGSADRFAATFTDPDQRFSAELTVTLAGGPFGGPSDGAQASLSTELLLTNTSGGDLDLTLFQYTDVDLFNTPGDDLAVFAGTPADAISVIDSTDLGRYDADFTPADAVEAALFGPLLASLNDGSASALAGTVLANGDVTHAQGWRTVLADGGTFLMRQTQQITVFPVPEPSLPALVAAAAPLLWAGNRRRSRA